MKYQFRILLSIVVVFVFLGCKKDKLINAPITGNNNTQKPSVSLLWGIGGASLSPQTDLTGMGIINMQVGAVAAKGHKINRVKILLSVDSATPIEILDSTLVPVESFLKLYNDVNVLNINGCNLMYTAIATQDNGKTDSTTILLQKPKVTFLWNTGSGYSANDGTIKRGASLSLKLSVKPSGDSVSTLTNASIHLSINDGPKFLVFDTNIFNISSFVKEITNIKGGNLAGAKLTFTASVVEQRFTISSLAVTDIPFTLTISDPAPLTVQTITDIMLGAQSNSGSFFNPTLGTNAAMSLTQANQNPANVHIVYYSSIPHNETFSAPLDVLITHYFSSIPNWVIRNNTQFRKTTFTAANFDNIQTGNSAAIDNELLSGVFNSRVTQLKVGDVIAYTNAKATHYALLKITAISPGASGFIMFDMKSPVF